MVRLGLSTVLAPCMYLCHGWALHRGPPPHLHLSLHPEVVQSKVPWGEDAAARYQLTRVTCWQSARGSIPPPNPQLLGNGVW